MKQKSHTHCHITAITVVMAAACFFSVTSAGQPMPCQSCQSTLEWAEIHLANPYDSAHDEEQYIEVLHSLVSSHKLTADEQMRSQLLLDDAKKNAIGDTAADISYVTRDGTAHRLSEIDSAKATLIYFNDPDCDACARVKARLDTCTTLRDLVTCGKLTVLAIYPYDNRDLWQNTTMPDYMLNGWDNNQEIDEQQTYVLPTLPLFYLLDRHKIVVLKNEPSLNRTLQAVKKIIR